MKYKIYQLTEPKVLSEIDTSDYYPAEKKKTVLEELSSMPYDFSDEHTTVEDAYAEVVKYKEKFKHLTLTIIPVINIHWDGEIS